MPTVSKDDRTLKTWAKRFKAYDAGEPIPKGLIGSLKRIAGKQSAPAAIVQKVNYELVWNTAFEWKITQDQTLQGLGWLQRREIQKLMAPEDKAILEGFSHFTFKGFDLRLRNRWVVALPVYRVHSKSGAWFDYISTPWQSRSFQGEDCLTFHVLSRGKA